MAIAIRSVTATLGSGASSTVAATTPSDTQTGDLLVFFHGNDFYTVAQMPIPTVTGSPTVNSIATADGGTNHAHVKAYWAVANTNGANTVTVTEDAPAGDEEKSMVVYVLTGANTASPIDDSDTATSAGSASHVAPALQPATSNAFMIIHDNSGDGFAASYTVPGSMAERYDANDGTFYSHVGATEQLVSSG